jgi:hypothetical protein
MPETEDRLALLAGREEVLPEHRRGRNGLSLDQERALAGLFACGWTPRRLARFYHVAPGTIAGVLRHHAALVAELRKPRPWRKGLP